MTNSNKTFKDIFNPEYKTFILNLKKNDDEYIKSKTIEERIDLSSEAMGIWNNYLEFERTFLAKNLVIKEATEIKLKELFQRSKQRDKQTLPSKEILRFLNEFAKFHKFDVFLHPCNLTMMINPHWGYFCKFEVSEIKIYFSI